MEEVKQNAAPEAKPERKKIMLSGIQPTGTFTLGNYLGAVRNWRQTQEDFQCAYFIADLHSLTVRQEPAKLRKQSIDAFALLLACGIDPQKSLVFVQSHVHAHAELGWILSCYSMFGDLHVAAKTGTAEVADGEDDGWIIGYVTDDDCPLAFAVCIEHGGFGISSAGVVVSEVLPVAAEAVRK